MKFFNSFNEYFQFALAREFVQRETYEPIPLRQNKVEKWGGFLIKPLVQPGDFALRNIRNPLFITAIVIISLALTTLIFYPALIPAFILSDAVKLGLYVMTQSTIIGLCLRTLGRLNNQELIDAWTNKELVPVRIGSEIIRVQKNV